MTTAAVRSTADTLGAHLQAIGRAIETGEVGPILDDYADDAILCTPDGAMRGKEQVRGFFTQMMPGLKGFSLAMKQQIIEGDYAYIAWSGSSSTIDAPIGTDTFVVRQGVIVFQTFAAHIVPKPQG